MSESVVACTKCHTPLSNDLLNTVKAVACPVCNTLLRVWVFPALFARMKTGVSGEAIVIDSEAGCFYHPQKRASIPCDACGRFLCAVCDVEINGEHLCPGCLQSGRSKGKLTELETKRTIYDSMALCLALIPLIIWPLTLLTGPAAVAMAIYALVKQQSLVPRSRISAYLAILFGAAEAIGWITFAVVLISRK